MLVYHFIANNGVGGVQSFVRSLAALNENHFVVYMKESNSSSFEGEENIIPFALRFLRTIGGLKSKRVVFHSHGSPLTLVFWLAKLFRIPIVHTVHNLAVYEAGTYRRKLHSAYYRYGGVKIVSICEAVSESFTNTYGFRPDFEIYNGVDADSVSAKAQHVNRDNNKVVFLGRFDAQKNVNLALDVAIALCERRPEALVEFYGRDLGDLDASCVSRAKRYHQISIHEETNRAAEVLASAKVCLITSRFEGFPILILEALAAGTYVISSDVGGINEILADCDVTSLMQCKDNIIREMVDGICRRLDESESPSLPARFEMAKVSEEYRQMYATVLNGI